MMFGRNLETLLADAMAAMQRSGFGAEAEQLAAAMRTPTLSSLEIVGEIGLAILRIQASVGGILPGPARRSLRRALRRVRQSWPGIQLSERG